MEYGHRSNTPGRHNSARPMGSARLFMAQAVRILVLLALLTGPDAAGPVLAQTSPAELDASITRLDEFRSGFSALRNELDSSRFDLEALGLELAFEDAAGIIAWVRDTIAFEQYPGLLRGAEGTLISGAGNALDQSVLLAILLGDAGYDVLIQRSELDREQAALLLQQMHGKKSVAPSLSASTVELPLELSAASLAEAEELVTEELRRLRSATVDTAEFIRTKLAEAGVEFGAETGPDLVEEARDYFWVDYRLGAGDAWSPAHVAFDEPPESLAALEPVQTLDSEIPEDLQHRFRFEVFIERRLGNELSVKPVMKAWERPVANMTGVTLTYVNGPDGMQGAADFAPRDEITANTNFFYPLFNGEVAAGAEAFDLLGSSAAPEEASHEAAGLFQSIGGLFGAAAGLLAEEENPADYVTLTAQWLDYTFISPGGEERTYRRTVFDRIGTENRQAGLVEISGNVSQQDAWTALATTHSFMVSSGSFSEDYVSDGSLAGTLALLDYTITALTDAASAGAPAPKPGKDTLTALQRVDHLKLYSAFDSVALPEDVISYRHEPALVIFEAGWEGGGQVDVVSNARRTLRVAPAQLPVPVAEWSLHAGIWETQVEDLPLRAQGIPTSNTFTVFEASEAAQIPIVTLAAGSGLQPGQLELPAETLAAIEADLAAGYTVITPAVLPAAGSHAAWWRVDANTGEALGRGGDGRGQALTEYLGMTLGQWGFLLSSATSIAGCVVNSGNNWQFACCLVEGTAVNLASAGLGTVVAKAFAWSALEAFLLLDVGTSASMLVYDVGLGVIPSFCSGLADAGCALPSEI